jgi:lysyl endopeptidase
MNRQTITLWLALALVLATASGTAAQTTEEPTVFLPLIESPAGEGQRVAGTTAAYADGAITPYLETRVERVVPFSLRQAGETQAASSVIDLQLPPLDVERLRQEDKARASQQRAVRIGVVRSLPQAVVAANAEDAPGRWQPTGDGGQFWTLTVESPGAKAIRLHVEGLVIPPGGHLMVYNTHQPDEVYGPYRQPDLFGAAELWTASVFGPVVTLEYYVPPGVNPTQVATFQVSEISHVYVEPASLLSPQEGTCHQDAMCDTGFLPESRAVAGMGTIGGMAGVLWCSGALLNDLDAETAEGYFLTANHCLTDSNSALGTQAQADTIEYYWLFQTNACLGTAPNPANVPRTVGGADLLSRQNRDSGNDHAFLRIRNALPGGLGLVGWDTANFVNGDAATGIHHPDGAFKRISYGAISNSSTNYWNVTWTAGVTEPGSSGSPIFDAAHRLRGQLFGGASSCTNQSGVDGYGRFNVTYPNIRRWLEIGGTIHVNGSYAGAESGTPSQPYRTINAANSIVWDGVRIKVRAGIYREAITINRPVVLVADGGPVIIGAR